jgi:hypothetical protein
MSKTDAAAPPDNRCVTRSRSAMRWAWNRNGAIAAKSGVTKTAVEQRLPRSTLNARSRKMPTK